MSSNERSYSESAGARIGKFLPFKAISALSESPKVFNSLTKAGRTSALPISRAARLTSTVTPESAGAQSTACFCAAFFSQSAVSRTSFPGDGASAAIRFSLSRGSPENKSPKRILSDLITAFSRKTTGSAKVSLCVSSHGDSARTGKTAGKNIAKARRKSRFIASILTISSC